MLSWDGDFCHSLLLLVSHHSVWLVSQHLVVRLEFEVVGYFQPLLDMCSIRTLGLLHKCGNMLCHPPG